MGWIDTKFEEPEIIKFVRLEGHGDAVEGVFVGVEERMNNFGKKERHIQIKTGTGQEGESVIESMRANDRLLAQVAAVKRGSEIRIEYVDDKANDGVDREGRPLSPTKLYKVQVSDGKPRERVPFE